MAKSTRQMMRGGCFQLALALSQRTGLPTWGLFDENGTMHHAFVWDGGKGTPIDARGRHRTLDAMRNFDGSDCAGKIARAADKAEIEEAYAEAVQVADERGRDRPASRRQSLAYIEDTPALRLLPQAKRKVKERAFASATPA